MLDSREPVANGRDRLVIGTRTKAHDAGLVCEHIHSSAEPALWVSDAIAWCHGAGGDWKRRIAPVIGTVVDLGQAHLSPTAVALQSPAKVHFRPPPQDRTHSAVRAM